MKSYLRLYTTMDVKKLAGFLEVEPEKLRGWLLVNKQRSRQIRWTDNGLLDGEVVNSNDLDYAMQGVSLLNRANVKHKIANKSNRILFIFLKQRSAAN